ncbi:MAG: AraC family transcriptional regulator [Proteobacteria bacterium]|nr:AraC family transcriptional regulator [Pseudomonadota bacterium]
MEVLQSSELDSRALFAEAGLNFAELDNSDARFEPEKVSLVWELAAARSGNPAIGLALSGVTSPASFDAVAYVMMSCSNLLAGLESLIRYIGIVSDAADIGLHKETNGYGVTIELVGGGRPIPRQRVEFVVLTILNLCRWITGTDLRPLAVDFVDPAPVDERPYVDAFKCPMNFDAPVHRLYFSNADISRQLPASNPVMAELLGRHAGEHLNRLGNTSIAHKVRELVIRRLQEGDPLRRKIAKVLCMSERTLQRRLHEEGTSFHDLVDDARREMAKQYLSRPRLPIVQTAYLLGFADQSTFSRACKRWFAVSPSEYRCRSGKDTR